MIRNLGEVEALQIVKEQGKIEVSCDFCGRTESFKRTRRCQAFR